MRKVDISTLLSRNQALSAISELPFFFLISKLLFVLCAFDLRKFDFANPCSRPSIPDFCRQGKVELAAINFSSWRALFQFCSGCYFAIAHGLRFRLSQICKCWFAHARSRHCARRTGISRAPSSPSTPVVCHRFRLFAAIVRPLRPH